MPQLRVSQGMIVPTTSTVPDGGGGGSIRPESKPWKPRLTATIEPSSSRIGVTIHAPGRPSFERLSIWMSAPRT